MTKSIICSNADHARSVLAKRTDRGPLPRFCEHCNRPRCTGTTEGPDGKPERCKKFPLKPDGETIHEACRTHGGRVDVQRSNRTRQELTKMGIFWNPDRPQITDIGKAVMDLASDLQWTYDSLKRRMDDRMETYVLAMADYRRMKEDGELSCICCGHFKTPPADPLDDSTARMWQFVVREMGTLFRNIQAMGLIEQAIKVEEAKVALLFTGLEAAAHKMDLSDEQVEVFRTEVIEAIRVAETKELTQ